MATFGHSKTVERAVVGVAMLAPLNSVSFYAVAVAWHESAPGLLVLVPLAE